MKNMYKFSYWDLLIPGVGVITTLIMLYAGASEEISYAITVISLFVEIAIIRIRCDVIKQVIELDENYRLINDMPTLSWKQDACRRSDELREILRSMVNGHKPISPGKITFEEDELLKRATSSIYSLNYIHSTIELQMRLLKCSKMNPLNGLLNAHCDVMCEVGNKKRVVIIDDSEIDTEDEHIVAMLDELADFNRKEYINGGMNFDVRFICLSKLTEEQIPEIGNLLLIDEQEATVVFDKTKYPSDYLEKNNKYCIRNLECQGIVNKTDIRKFKEVFDSIWKKALDINSFIGRSKMI